MDEQNDYNEFDLEPVVYCTKCYSLKIKHEDIIDVDCCMDCGCSDVATTTIGEWEKLYEGRYGNKFVKKESNPEKHPIFLLPLKELKEKVFTSPDWKKIIYTLYPYFPKRMDKADAIIYFFDKLTKDNRFDDLRLLLINYSKKKHYGREEGKKG